MTLRFVGTLVAILVLGVLPACDEGEDWRPNVLVILTDDQTLESLRVMAGTRELIADRGVEFTTSIATYPLCCPARATLLTGQYAHNTGVLHNFSGHRVPGGYPAYRDGSEPEALPAALQQNGYRTALVGKYLNEYGLDDPTTVPPGWDEWAGGITPTINDYWGAHINHNGTVVDHTGEYQTDVLTDYAVEVIDGHDPSEGPFFLLTSYFAPHYDGPTRTRTGDHRALPAERHAGRYDGAVLRSPAVNHRDPRKPGYTRSQAPLDRADRDDLAAQYQSELEALLAVDEGVRALDDALTRAGLRENTIVVFTSDNGYLHGEHRHTNQKHLPYEPSIRVPLLVAGPGIARGTSDALTANVDLAPTIYDYTGTEPLLAPDGVSLRPLLEEPSTRWSRRVLLTGRVGHRSKPVFDGVRTRTHTFVRYWIRGVFRYELFDLRRDPHQLRNLVRPASGRAFNPANQPIADRLATRTVRLRGCQAANCVDTVVLD